MKATTFASDSTATAAADALASLSLSAGDKVATSTTTATTTATTSPAVPTPASKPAKAPREPLRRDSLKRRESLLKGKDGSRRRQRWENDRLLGNLYAQPPLPSDWEVHPTHPVHVVPYYLAPLWDAGLSQRVAKTKSREARKTHHANEDPATRIPKELRATFKRAKAAKGLLQDLEEQVRAFVTAWQAPEEAKGDRQMEVDSEDDEIVFVGRKGEMSDVQSYTGSEDEEELAKAEREILLMQNPVEDRGAKFGRWLVHNIASYYGLRTWSITKGDPALREAYVGMPQGNDEVRPVEVGASLGNLPLPLWGLV